MPAGTTWKADVLHLLHVCHVPWKSEQSVDITVLGTLFWKTFLYIVHSVKLQWCSFMTLYVSSTLHTLMDFAKASRLNEANRRYDQWKLELSHAYSSKKSTTHTLLQGTRTRRGWYKLLLYVLFHVAPSIRGHRKGW
jgi:hypothetical protein